MIWEFDQEGVHYYSCGDFHVEREWACGHSAYTEYFLMGECVREVGELKEYAKGWGEENDYHAVLNNCQVFFFFNIIFPFYSSTLLPSKLSYSFP